MTVHRSQIGQAYIFKKHPGNQQLLDLTMNSRLGNKKNRIPVVSDLIGGAGDQIAQVRIEGPLHDPSVWQERFPCSW